MKALRFAGLAGLVFLVGAALAACTSTTAPVAATISGAWDGTASMTGAAPTALHLILTEHPDGNLSGSGSWGTNASAVPLTVVTGMQENVVYAGRAESEVSLRVHSTTMGYGDLNGVLNGGTFTGSISWWTLVPQQSFAVTLTR